MQNLHSKPQPQLQQKLRARLQTRFKCVLLFSVLLTQACNRTEMPKNYEDKQSNKTEITELKDLPTVNDLIKINLHLKKIKLLDTADLLKYDIDKDKDKFITQKDLDSLSNIIVGK